MTPLFSTVLFLTVVASALASYDNNVYLIRHGEKPSNGGQGLAPAGKERAQCLTTVFGPDSTYDIGYILAQKPKKNGKRTRPLETVIPLARELGLTVDTSCDRDDVHCVTEAIEAFAKTSSANILICWEHHTLGKIVKSLGVEKAPEYPGHAFDIIWTVQDEHLISQTSENCARLDEMQQEAPSSVTEHERSRVFRVQ